LCNGSCVSAVLWYILINCSEWLLYHHP
jgi:hypothetical protein